MSQIPETANKGLENIVACTTEVSTIHDTTLLYRGYTIEDLAQNCSFEEVVYLLWFKKLPNQTELKDFKSNLNSHLVLPKAMQPILESIALTQAHPMAKLRTAVSYFGLLDPQAEDISLEGIRAKALHLTGALSAIVCTLSRLEQKQDTSDPVPDQSFAWNFLKRILGKTPIRKKKLFSIQLSSSMPIMNSMLLLLQPAWSHLQRAIITAILQRH